MKSSVVCPTLRHYKVAAHVRHLVGLVCLQLVVWNQESHDFHQDQAYPHDLWHHRTCSRSNFLQGANYNVQVIPPICPVEESYS